ncbi:MAG: hypothetical protein U9Q12_03660, partial [Patescibacteria group bacterium]|nr:hypothetical protein [Patescibacteria group bacterium]
MNSKKWIKIWFFVVLLVPVVGAFNYLIDPYGLNNFLDQERINQFKKRNTGYATRLKTKRLREGKFDTIMLGASKIGVMDPTVVDEYTKGNTYNLSAPASTTEQQYEMFMYAMEYNQIDTLIYGIDFSSFNQSLTLKDDYKEYYDLRGKVVNKQKISNYDLYFNLKTLKDSFYVLWKNFLGEEIAEQRFLYENGMQDFLRRIFLSKNKKFDVKKGIDNKITVLLHPDKGLYKNYSF